MFTHYRTQGFFLKKEDKGESDQLLYVFTKDFGKIEILAKGIRKIRSKLRSRADIFCLSEIEFIQGKIYKTVVDAILVEKFKDIKKNPEKLKLAYKITDAFNCLTGLEEKDDELWNLLNRTFQRLNNCQLSIVNCQLLYYFSLWSLFSILGYEPELYYCVTCQKKLLPETFWFLPSEGGIICWRCIKDFTKEEKKILKEIKIETVKILRIFLKQDWKILDQIKIEDQNLKNLEEISCAYLEFFKEK